MSVSRVIRSVNPIHREKLDAEIKELEGTMQEIFEHAKSCLIDDSAEGL